jgi:purine nucleoside phosphorylase
MVTFNHPLPSSKARLSTSADGVLHDDFLPGPQVQLDDSIEKPRMRYFCGNPIVCHRREADCSDADGRHLSRAFRF